MTSFLGSYYKMCSIKTMAENKKEENKKEEEQWNDKYTMAFSYNGIPSSNLKKQTTII